MDLYVMLSALSFLPDCFLLFTATCPFLQTSLATYVTIIPFTYHFFLLKYNVSALLPASYPLDHIANGIWGTSENLKNSLVI